MLFNASSEPVAFSLPPGWWTLLTSSAGEDAGNAPPSGHRGGFPLPGCALALLQHEPEAAGAQPDPARDYLP